MKHRFSAILVVVCLGLALCASVTPAHAQGRPGPARLIDEAGAFFDFVPANLGAVWGWLQNLWAANYSSIDPNGASVSTSSSSSSTLISLTENNCIPTTQNNASCDPNG